MFLTADERSETSGHVAAQGNRRNRESGPSQHSSFKKRNFGDGSLWVRRSAVQEMKRGYEAGPDAFGTPEQD